MRSPLGLIMKVSINANICDVQTKKLVLELHEPLKKLSQYLSQDFGGEMENLWIDIELSSFTAHLPPHKFRFQKRVSGVSKIISGVKFADSLNVGHYSVKPDLKTLMSSTDQINYLLNQVYNSTSILLDKKKKFPGFSPEKFRSEFLNGCAELGYAINN